MAGLGYNTATNMVNSSTRNPMGIQFVKSTETVGSNPNSSNESQPSQVTNNTRTGTDSSAIPSLMSCQLAPYGQPNHNPSINKHASTPYRQAFVKSGEVYSSVRPNNSAQGSSSGYRMPGQSNLNKGGPQGGAPTTVKTFQRLAEAKPVCSVDEYLRAWKQEKDPDITRIRKLAYEVISLKSDRPNAKDKLHSAANRVPLRIEFNTRPVFGAKNNNSFLCFVYIEGVSIASGQGPKMKDAKTNAYEASLQKILMPYLRIVSVDPTSRELQVSKEPFTSPPPEPSKVPLNTSQSASAKDTSKEIPSQHKESNLEAAGLKRRYNEYKPLDEFVIVEPKIPIQDCTAAHTLRRSADFNHMLLEYEYFFKGEAARCVLRIENEVLADVNGVSKAAAKNTASAQALLKLKEFCWIIKTKQAVDSNTKISKDEMLNELNEQSDSISHDNIGNKLLRKMGWSGGGVGKDGSGIAEPVSLKSVLNREGLGLSATKGVTDEFRKRIKEVIENYAASDNQEDLVFSCDFRLEERQIIHDECRRLNLRSKSRGKGQKRYLCVRRKRSVNQLFDHLMSVGGETARYQLVPPGQDVSVPPAISSSCSVYRSQSCDSSPKSFLPKPNSDNTKGTMSFLSKDPKQFVPQTLIRNIAPSSNSNVFAYSNSNSGMQTNHRQLETPNLGAGLPGSFKNNMGIGNKAMGSRPGLLGNYPPQNRFTGPFGNGSNTVHNNGPHVQSSASNIMGGDSFRMGFNNDQNNAGVDSRANVMNNMECFPQNNNGSMMFSAQRNAPPIFRPSGNNDKDGHYTNMASNGFQPNPINSYAFRQGGSTFQGHQNNMSMNRMSFNNGTNGLPMGTGGDQGMTMPGTNMAHPGWNGPGPRSQFNPNRQWGDANGYPNQYTQQPGLGMNSFNPNMMGGPR